MENPAASREPVLFYAFEVKPPYSIQSVISALSRAAFLLRKEGNGAYDNQQAEVIESLMANVKDF